MEAVRPSHWVSPLAWQSKVAGETLEVIKTDLYRLDYCDAWNELEEQNRERWKMVRTTR